MSTSVSFGRRFEDTTLATTGSATATISGEVLTCASVSGESAKATKYVALRPGELLKATVMAKRISGPVASSGQILINALGVKDRISIDSDDWKEYSVSWQNPITAADAAFISVELGSFLADAGSVKFCKPRVEIFKPTSAALRTHACGLITLAAGVPSLNTSFTSFGIYSLSYSSGSKELTIATEKTSGAAYSSPLIFAGMTLDGNGVKITPKPGAWAPAAGTFKLKFSDNTGVFVDIAALGTMHVWLKMEIA